MPFADDRGGARVALVHRGAGYTVSATSGIIAAALAQDSLIFSLRHNVPSAAGPPPTGTNKRLFLARYVVEFTTITAFTTPVVAARRLGLYRGASGTPSGGTALTPVAMDSATSSPAADLPVDVRIATVGTLTPNAFVREANPFDQISLAHVGAAGAFRDRSYVYHGSAPPLELNPNEAWVISNPVLFDAAGTFQISVTFDFQVAGQVQ